MPTELPSVSVVFLAFNRSVDLLSSLEQTRENMDYPRKLIDVIVVDNASTDGTAEVLRERHPEVQLIERSWNCGVSGFNDGLVAAEGDWVLALDDDCHLPGDGLARAIEAAEASGADLVSFGVRSSFDADFRFDQDYRTGLVTFWGCAVLMRREVVRSLGGYDPEIFVWANEVEFTMRLYDRGFSHLHAPDIVAVHAKEPTNGFLERNYRFNARNFGYVAGKLLRARDLPAVAFALAANDVRDAIRHDSRAFKALPDTFLGLANGVRHRSPVRQEVSSAYRRNFENFISPFTMARSMKKLASDTVRRTRVTGDLGRREAWRDERPEFYPRGRQALRF